MFAIVKSESDFITWTTTTESHLAADPRISFVVGFVAFERYLKRLSTPFVPPTDDEQGKRTPPQNMSGAWGRLRKCYGRKSTRWAELEAALMSVGVDEKRIDGWRNIRNDIVHGDHERTRKALAAEAKVTWETLRILARHPRQIRGIDKEWSAFSRRPVRNPAARQKTKD